MKQNQQDKAQLTQAPIPTKGVKVPCERWKMSHESLRQCYPLIEAIAKRDDTL